MSRSILVFCLHPAPGSFNHAPADEIAEGASGAGHDVTRLNLSAMQFDADFGQSGFKGAKPPEPDLEAALQAIGAAAHVVLVTPIVVTLIATISSIYAARHAAHVQPAEAMQEKE